MINASKLTYSLLLASLVTGISVLPARADDLSQPAAPAVPPAYQNNAGVIGAPMPPQTMSAQKYGQAANQQPVYVWQGNHPDSAALGTAGLPRPVQVGGVRYITGGIGDEEREALEAVKNEYDLHVTSTNNSGEFNGDTLVTVFDQKGQAVLNVTAGPLFYADLPAGTYTVKATSGGQSEERKITVGDSKKSSSVYFRW